MRIFRELAGYSLGRADIVRRAMSKKKHKVMEEEREYFIHGLRRDDGTVEIEGCVARGVDERTAEIIYDEMKSFASYAFNKFARRRVRGRRLPHGVPQILLPEGVYGRAAHQRARLLRQGCCLHGGVRAHRHPGPAAARQRERHRLLRFGGQHPLRPARDQEPRPRRDPAHAAGARARREIPQLLRLLQAHAGGGT